MREIRALIWKEWCETRLFLWIAWALFIGMPVIDGIERRTMSHEHFGFFGWPWVIFATPILAIVMGVAGTCRDLQTKLEDFWQSRPLGGLRLFIVKYLAGLGIILIAAGVPLSIDTAFNHDVFAIQLGLAMFPQWAAIFAIAFASGCILHKPAQAAAVAVVGMLVIYFLPIIFPPLQSFNVGMLDIFEPQQAGLTALSRGDVPIFAAGMFTVSLLMGGVGLIAVQLHWHFESGGRLVGVATAVAFLALIASASYQLGTNLKVLQQIDLPERQTASVLPMRDGSVGVQFFGENPLTPGTTNAFSRSISLSNDSMVLGDVRDWQPIIRSQSATVDYCQTDPAIQYYIGQDDNGIYQLGIIRWKAKAYDSHPTMIALWPQNGPPSAGDLFLPRLYQHQGHLYIVGRRTIVFDISEPLLPKLISNDPVAWHPDWEQIGVEAPVLSLPPIPDLSDRQRLIFLMNMLTSPPGQDAFDGDTWCRFNYASAKATASFWTFKLNLLTHDRAEYRLVGRYEPNLVQSLVGGDSYHGLQIENDLLYAESERAGTAIFKIEDNGPVKLLAHFVAPGVHHLLPLADGRAIASGDKLWLLAAPTR